MLRVPHTNDDIDPLPSTHQLGKSQRQLAEEAAKANPDNKRTNLHDNIFVDMLGRMLNLPPKPTTPRTKAEADKAAKVVDKLVAKAVDKTSTKVERTTKYAVGDVLQYKSTHGSLDDVYRRVDRIKTSHNARGDRIFFTTGGFNSERTCDEDMNVVLPAGSDDWIPFAATADSECPKGIEDWKIEIMTKSGARIVNTPPKNASNFVWDTSFHSCPAFWRPAR